MMMKFSKEHEWVRVEGDKAYVGITAYAAEQLGDVVFVELPEVGAAKKMNERLAVVESVKAVSDVYSPVSCEVLQVNEALLDAPDLLNQDAEGEAWIAVVAVKNPDELNELMTAEEYAEYVAKEGH